MRLTCWFFAFLQMAQVQFFPRPQGWWTAGAFLAFFADAGGDAEASVASAGRFPLQQSSWPPAAYASELVNVVCAACLFACAGTLFEEQRELKFCGKCRQYYRI